MLLWAGLLTSLCLHFLSYTAVIKNAYFPEAEEEAEVRTRMNDSGLWSCLCLAGVVKSAILNMPCEVLPTLEISVDTPTPNKEREDQRCRVWPRFTLLAAEPGI